MGMVVTIPSKPDLISRRQWIAFVLMRKNIDAWRAELLKAEAEYEKLRVEILARLLDGAGIEGGGRILLENGGGETG